MRAADVLVVGGGIVGTSAAALLAEAGAAVTLVEATVIAAGASGRNSGVVQHPFDPALRDLHGATVASYRELAAEDGLGFAFPSRPAGLLLVSLAPGGPRRMATDLAAAWPELEPEFIEARDLQRLEPGLAPEISACRLRIGYPVPPAAATRAYGELARRRGARILEGQAVAALVRDGDQVVGVRLVDGTTMAAGAVLVATGAATSQLVDPGGRWRPIRPLWGVVVDVGLEDPPRHVLEEAEMDEALGDAARPAPEAAHPAPASGATTPAPDVARPAAEAGTAAIEAERPEFSLVTAAGRSSLGSTFLDREPDPEAWIQRLVDRGRRFVPSIADAAVGPVRACPRPASLDGRPLIGPLPGLPGAFVAAGHGPWGISTGPASARLVSEAILGRPVAIPTELAANRFGPAS